jgi:hypothetical protein
MQNFTKTTTKLKIPDKYVRNENGLQSLAAYYQSLFDIEENLNHYSSDEYLNAKRKFVKYLMNNRAL